VKEKSGKYILVITIFSNQLLGPDVFKLMPNASITPFRQFRKSTKKFN